MSDFNFSAMIAEAVGQYNNTTAVIRCSNYFSRICLTVHMHILPCILPGLKVMLCNYRKFFLDSRPLIHWET